MFKTLGMLYSVVTVIHFQYKLFSYDGQILIDRDRFKKVIITGAFLYHMKYTWLKYWNDPRMKFPHEKCLFRQHIICMNIGNLTKSRANGQLIKPFRTVCRYTYFVYTLLSRPLLINVSRNRHCCKPKGLI